MKKYIITNLSNFFLHKINGDYIISKNNNKEEYLKVPSYIDIITDHNSCSFTINNKYQDKSLFNQFIENLSLFLKLNKKQPFVKRLKIRGLGYKALQENDYLLLNLGYSVPIKIKIPKRISKIAIKKNTIIITSYDKTFLGNFVSLLCSSKKKDAYKGKGLFLEYESPNLKQVKKK